MTRPALAIAALASVMAGVIHIAAARNHDGDLLLGRMFALSAAAQIVWGVAVMLRPRVRVVLLGLVINAGAALVWLLSRTVGISFIHDLSVREPVGVPDLSGAVFAGLGVLAAALVVLRPVTQRRVTPSWLGAMAAVALVATLPALSAKQAHEHDGQAHLETASADHTAIDHTAIDHTTIDHTAIDGTAAAHEDAHAGDPLDHAATPDGSAAHHSSGETAAGMPHDGHNAAGAPGNHTEHQPADPDDPHVGHPPPDPGDPPNPDDPHVGHPPPDPDPAGPITSLDDPRLTQEQWDGAVALLISTTSSMGAFLTEEDIVAAGYTPIGDGGQPGQFEHFVNWSYLTDTFEVDPAHIESIVMKMNADGTKRVVAALYILTLGKTMADVPDIAGSLTTWHDHDNLCFSGTQVVGLAVDGVCATGTLVDTPPMIHVWIEANPCGPFAGIDEHGVMCDAPPEH